MPNLPASCSTHYITRVQHVQTKKLEWGGISEIWYLVQGCSTQQEWLLHSCVNIQTTQGWLSHLEFVFKLGRRNSLSLPSGFAWSLKLILPGVLLVVSSVETITWESKGKQTNVNCLVARVNAEMLLWSRTVWGLPPFPAGPVLALSKVL